MRIPVWILTGCLLTAHGWTETAGKVTAGQLSFQLRDAWVADSSTTFVRIIAVPYAARDHKLVKGQPRIEVTVWCQGRFGQATLNMGRVDVYDSNDNVFKYSWTKPADTRAVFGELSRRADAFTLSTRIAGARPESGDTSGSWNLRLTSVK